MLKKETNIIVKKLLKNKWKILTIEKIKKMFEDLWVEWNIYKKIYFLKNWGYLVSLKKDLYYVKDVSEEVDEEDIIQRFYWKLLYSWLKQQYWNDYLIWWIKALEIWNNNFDIPDKITIINPYKRSLETLLKWKKIFNTVYKVKSEDPMKFFKFLKKNTEKISIDWKNFIVANYELSLLESLYSLSSLEQRYVEELVKKNIRKNYKRIRLDLIENFLKLGKYGSSCVKLYELARLIRPDFAEKLKNILKKWYYF